MILLQILIASFGEAGLHRLSKVALPHLDGVEYLVSLQIPDGILPTIPSSLRREDVKIFDSPTRGLSRNRNLLLDLASAPYCLIADDDISYSETGLKELLKAFEKYPEIDIFLLRYLNENGLLPKPYPEIPSKLKDVPKGHYLTSFEIAFRRQAVMETGVYFNTLFGIGSNRYPCGEEDLWLDALIRMGLEVLVIPVEIGVHPGETTGERRMSDPGVLRAQGAVISRLYPFSSIIRVPLKAWRVSRRSHVALSKTLIPAIKGWLEGTFTRKKLFGHRND